tara:strand:+ start:257 stop:463 length:207 start_codon:yes stop_codon:yes gene_type:complete
MSWKDILKQDEQAKIDKLKNWIEINPFLKDKPGLRQTATRLEETKGTPEFEQVFSTLKPYIQDFLNKP